MTTSLARLSPRALILAASIGWRHAAADPVRALLLAWRVLPGPLRRWLRFAGRYGRATALWGAGERDAALASLAESNRKRRARTRRLLEAHLSILPAPRAHFGHRG